MYAYPLTKLQNRISWLNWQDFLCFSEISFTFCSSWRGIICSFAIKDFLQLVPSESRTNMFNGVTSKIIFSKRTKSFVKNLCLCLNIRPLSTSKKKKTIRLRAKFKSQNSIQNQTSSINNEDQRKCNLIGDQQMLARGGLGFASLENVDKLQTDLIN